MKEGENKKTKEKKQKDNDVKVKERTIVSVTTWVQNLQKRCTHSGIVKTDTKDSFNYLQLRYLKRFPKKNLN